MNQQTGLSADARLAALNEAKRSQLPQRGLGTAPLQRIYGPASGAGGGADTLWFWVAGLERAAAAALIYAPFVSPCPFRLQLCFPSAELLQLGRVG